MLKPVLLVSCRYSVLSVYDFRKSVKQTYSVCELQESGYFAFSLI